MKKKLLITGSSGFIGSFLVEEAIHKGYEVFAGIRRTSSKQFLQHEGLKFFELDFSSPEHLQNALLEFKDQYGNLDLVIHNAGITKAKQPADFYTVNFEYTKSLAEAIINTGMNLEKFVLVSSLASFGPGREAMMEPIKVSDLPRPISGYGDSKLKAAEYISSIKAFPYVIVHPTGVYGPRDKDFFQFIKLVSRGIEPYIGSHKQALSFIYVKDLAKAIVGVLGSGIKDCSYLVSDRKGYDKEQIGVEAKYNLGKRTLKLRLPLRLMKAAVKTNDSIQQLLYKRLPFINSEKLTEISSANWLCNSDEIWEHINDAPRYDLKSGVAETIQWYKENKWL
jgi:UDP-glucose 4-epimerase